MRKNLSPTDSDPFVCFVYSVVKPESKFSLCLGVSVVHPKLLKMSGDKR